jgi:hypothetical protein
MEREKANTIHITRRQDWFDKNNYNAISLAEWISYVKSDRQMQLINEIELPLKKYGLSNNNLIYRSEGLSFWKVLSYEGEVVFDVWFEYERGNIDVRIPDRETIKKMIAIAGRLGAKVQGDKGEMYEPAYYFPVVVSKKPWWKFW